MCIYTIHQKKILYELSQKNVEMLWTFQIIILRFWLVLHRWWKIPLKFDMQGYRCFFLYQIRFEGSVKNHLKKRIFLMHVVKQAITMNSGEPMDTKRS